MKRYLLLVLAVLAFGTPRPAFAWLAGWQLGDMIQRLKEHQKQEPKQTQPKHAPQSIEAGRPLR